MEVQKLTHEVRLQKWNGIVRSCRSSGKTIKSWCDENNINLKTYYYWQKRVCQAACRELALTQESSPQAASVNSSPVFAEIRRPPHEAGNVAVSIQSRDLQIHIYGGAATATVQGSIKGAWPPMLGDISQAERIYLACGYTDMRKSIDRVRKNYKLGITSRRRLIKVLLVGRRFLNKTGIIRSMQTSNLIRFP